MQEFWFNVLISTLISTHTTLNVTFYQLEQISHKIAKGWSKNLDCYKSRNWHAENFDWTISTLTTNQFDY